MFAPKYLDLSKLIGFTMKIMFIKKIVTDISGIIKVISGDPRVDTNSTLHLISWAPLSGPAKCCICGCGPSIRRSDAAIISITIDEDGC